MKPAADEPRNYDLVFTDNHADDNAGANDDDIDRMRTRVCTDGTRENGRESERARARERERVCERERETEEKVEGTLW